MKVSALLFTLSLVSAAVKREAEPDADADPQVLHGHKPVSVSAPECHSVPELKCVPRQVETPRKVCHQEYDEIVDTVYTEHCEEVITTTCQQTSTKSILSKQVVGHDSKVVATGVAATPPVTVAHGAPHHGGGVGPAKAVVGPASHHLGKREAEPTAEAEAAFIGPHVAHPGPAEIHETPAQVSQPVCHSVPVKQCEKIPTHTPRYTIIIIIITIITNHHDHRRVGRTVCAEHVDVTTIEDCQEVITTKCHQVSQSVAHASNVVGHDTRVGPAAVVAVEAHHAPVHAVHHAPVHAVRAPAHTAVLRG